MACGGLLAVCCKIAFIIVLLRIQGKIYCFKDNFYTTTKQRDQTCRKTYGPSGTMPEPLRAVNNCIL